MSTLAYERLRTEATLLAGEPGDIPQRAALLHAIYRDSHGNHAFPQIALHGAAWAWGFFESTGRLGRLIRHRYFYSRKERAYRMGLLERFSEGFRKANRAVFIDTYTNYYFTKTHGRSPEAARLLRPELLEALNEMHEAATRRQSLPVDSRRDLFLCALRWEQEVTVAPAVKAEVERFDCPILTFLCLKPVVRFSYFPRWRFLLFGNFADTAERIEKATASYELAERAGWEAVCERVRDYGVLPEAAFGDPLGYAEGLRVRIRARANGGSYA